MENRRIVQLIQNPNLIQFSDKILIEKELEKYPFVQSFHFLKLKWKQLFAKNEIKDAIESLSLYSNYRELIKETLEKPLLYEPEVVQKETKNIEPVPVSLSKEKLENTEKEYVRTLTVEPEYSKERVVPVVLEEKDTKIDLEKKANSNIDKLGISHLFSQEKENLVLEDLSKAEPEASQKDKIEEGTLSRVEDYEAEQKIVTKKKEFLTEKVPLTNNETIEKEEAVNIRADILVEDSSLPVVEKEIETKLENTTVEKNSIEEEVVVDDLEPIETDIEEEAILPTQDLTGVREEPKKEIILGTEEKLSFTEWLSLPKSTAKKNEIILVKEKQQNIINKFIEANPKIETLTKKEIKTVGINFKNEDVKEIANLMTETLAQLYVEQGRYDTAVAAFKILSLKFPEKSSFFAKEIRKIRKTK